MRLFLILIIFFCGSTVYCQNFGDTYTGGWETINYVKKDLNKKTKLANKKRIVTSSTDLFGDTLVFILHDQYDGFVIKTTFNLNQPDLEEKFCDFQQIEFDCTPCGSKHLQEIINMNNFRQKSENVYMSSYSYQTEMTVKYKSESRECLVVMFRHIDTPKKEYKKQYRQLKKKTTA